jgi:hypothetical protein
MIIIKKTILAPVVLFVYNRPEHTKRTVEALAANKLAAESDLIVFSDGPKDDNAISKIGKVRAFVDEIKGFASVRVIKRDKNLGLASSVITGVTQVIDEYGKVIVLEDDLLTSRFFLEYMNDGLDLYENSEDVSSINGYIFPLNAPSLPKSFFLPHSDCWGWGTWKRVWDNFNADAGDLFKQIKQRGLIDKFDFDSSCSFTNLLKQQIKGSVDSWAIRWYATNFLLGLKGLYPGESFVQNIGYDGSGTHCDEVEWELYNSALAEDYNKIERIPIEVDQVMYGYVKEYYKSTCIRRDPLIESMFDIVRSILPRKVLLFIRKIRTGKLNKL